MIPAHAAEPTDAEFAALQVLQVELALGAELSPERRAAVAQALAAKCYSRIDLERAALTLSADVELDRKLRYGKQLSAADFARVIDGDPEDKDARRRRLMTAEERNVEAARLRLSVADYAPVFVEGQAVPMWTLKGA